ncbi:hypothetical protein EVAR_15091_1 [Eumeta japonica]|uniref:Uncharacterized protein n=1 Tax=Eumeta variegata TaxID=151549 RepID=A0A4C1UIC5_EUMVA|nr:hypothetical protein EVAR_15091_1 [Eumeta japonica]
MAKIGMRGVWRPKMTVYVGETLKTILKRTMAFPCRNCELHDRTPQRTRYRLATEFLVRRSDVKMQLPACRGVHRSCNKTKRRRGHFN